MSGQPAAISATSTSERVYLPLGEARDMLVLRMARAATAALERARLTVVRGPDLAWQDPDLGAIDAGAILLVQPMMVHRLRWSERQSVVIVSTDGETSSHMTSGFDVVTIDQAQGGRLAGEHLRGLGVTDACFFGVYDGLPGDYATLDAQRLEGFERALGRSIPPERRFYCRYYTEESAARLVPEYLRLNPRPRAVFAASDELALGFLIGAAAHGLSAQRDYLLVGFDGQHRARTLTPGPLSTVEVPSEAMGEQAAEFLLSRLRSPALPPRRATLGCTFLAGATTLERARNTAGPLGTLPGRR